MNLQRRTMEILDRGKEGDRASIWCDRVITTMVILNVIAVVLETVSWLEHLEHSLFARFELFSIAFFTVEFLLRLWSSGARFGAGRAWQGRRAYLLSFSGVVDIVSILPFYLQMLFPGLDLRILRILRLVRLLKLSHYSTAIEDLVEAVRAERRAFAATLYLLSIALTLTSALMYFAERGVQPDKFSSIPHAMYWSAITLTTVGYGDVSPMTPLGRAISVLTAFLGVSTVAMLTGIVASSFANQVTRRRVLYEAQLREALADGKISGEEEMMLEQLREEFDFTPRQIAEIRSRVLHELRTSRHHR
jgi:voltage-gated potassium channel